MSTYGYLAHHGVKGQRWGVRRYQNEDGSLTALGREHYGIGERAVAKLQDTAIKRIRKMSPEQKERLKKTIEEYPKRQEEIQEKRKDYRKTALILSGASLASVALAAISTVAIVGGISALSNPEATIQLTKDALKTIGSVALDAARGIGEATLDLVANAGALKDVAKELIQDKIKSPKAEKAMAGEGRFNTLTKMAKAVAKNGTTSQKEKFVLDNLTDLKGNKTAFGLMSDTILKMQNKGTLDSKTLTSAVNNFGQLGKAKSGAKEGLAAGTLIGGLTAFIGGAASPVVGLVNELNKVKNAYDSPVGKMAQKKGKEIIDKMGLSEEELKKKQGGNQ